MPLNPGNDTITFIQLRRTGQPDRYGVIQPTETTSVVRGCSLQPMSEKDQITNTTFSEATDKCLTPATDFVQAIEPQDFLADKDGVRYRIIGIRPYRDSWGRLDHITFLCKHEEG